MANRRKYSTLNLQPSLRDELISTFSKYSSLLDGGCMKNDHLAKLVNNNWNLIRRLLVLSSGNEHNLKKKLFLIDESLVEGLDVDEDNSGLFYNLFFSSRLNIIDLLIKNLNAAVLLDDSTTSDKDKKNLKRENTDLVLLLLNLDTKSKNDKVGGEGIERPKKKFKIENHNNPNQENDSQQIRMETSFINENVQFQNNQTNGHGPSFADLTFNLSWILRNDILVHIIECLPLLNGVTIKANREKELFNKSQNLIKRLSILSVGDNSEAKFRKNLNLIDERLLEDLDLNCDGLFYELNSTLRHGLIDLLIKNFNVIALFNNLVSYQDKDKLIKENNDLVNLLLHLKVKPLFDDLTKDDSVKDGLTKDGSAKDDSIKDGLTKNGSTKDGSTKDGSTKDDLTKNDSTKDKNTGDRVEFAFEIAGVKEFLSARREVYSNALKDYPSFYLSCISNNKIGGVKYIGFYLNSLNLKDCLYQTECVTLKLYHPTDPTLNKMDLVQNYLFAGTDGKGYSNFITHANLLKFIKDDRIKLGIEMNVKKIVKDKSD